MEWRKGVDVARSGGAEGREEWQKAITMEKAMWKGRTVNGVAWKTTSDGFWEKDDVKANEMKKVERVA